ncbi:S-layer homology domain-containing protein [Paenibacillus sp. URB8-2]|uniref:S-layer homology domain-containing protein n=1 Tax=Paenibacillus sp. URB8-2 TaxID=2741301 RepID=UPI0015B8FEDC|nr:S-layer homology domain-containing protein [Paenibacillus sp. URB8-2]BCG60785.1 hypothetical protein PUR_42100 [Paenibacillus sp. URB8-2]
MKNDNYKKLMRWMICVWMMIILIIQATVPAFAAYNTRPLKMYPKLDEVEIASGQSSSFEIHLKFSNNVGFIDETQEDRYDMTGYNAKNLTKFHMKEAKSGKEIPVKVTPHPQALKHTEESKYLYVYAEGLDPKTDYILYIDEDLYANMGNSLGSPYEILFNLSADPQVIKWGPTVPLPINNVTIPPLYMTESSIKNSQKGVPVDTSITLTFSFNVSGPEMLTYNSELFFLFEEGTKSIPIEVKAGETVNDFVIKPILPLKEGTEYKIVVVKELSAKNGSTMSSPINLYFKSVKPGSDDDADQEVAENNFTYFTDIANSWARDEINALADLGIINGFADGTYHPNEYNSRAEIAAILVRAFDLESNTTISFNDTKNHWAENYISTAAASGIVKGINADRFAPNEKVTREQLVVMLIRASGLNLKDKNPSKDNSKESSVTTEVYQGSSDGAKTPVLQGSSAATLLDFIDEATVSDWAKDSMEIAIKNGIIHGYSDKTLGPQANVTRAEACKMINTLLGLP